MRTRTSVFRCCFLAVCSVFCVFMTMPGISFFFLSILRNLGTTCSSLFTVTLRIVCLAGRMVGLVPWAWGHCYRLNICVPPKFMCWTPNPQCDGVWRWWGHGGGALMNGIGALIKETLESPPLLSHGDRVTRQPPVRWDVGPQQTPSLPLPLSWTSQLLAVNNKFLSFKSHPSLWYFWHSSLNRLR